MEALDTPFISRTPMGEGHAFLSEHRKLMYASDRYNDNTL